MNDFFNKFLLVVLIFINATFLFSQQTSNVDSLIYVVKNKIDIEEYTQAKLLLEYLQILPEYKIDSIKLKVDFTEVILLKAIGENEKVLEILLEGFSIIKNNKSSKYISDYAFEIGSVFSKEKNYERAFQYFRLVLESSQFRKDSLGMSRGYLGLGSMHLHLFQDSKMGITKVMDSVTLKSRSDSIVYFYNKALLILPLAKDYQNDRAEVFANLLVYSFYQEKYGEAEKYGLLSLNIHKESMDSLEMSRDFNLLGAINIKLENFEKSQEFYSQGLRLIEKKKSFKSLESKEKFIQNLSQVYFLLGDYKKAYEYRVNAYNLNDSLVLASSTGKYSEIEAKYNFSEKEKQTEIEKNKRQKAEFLLYVFVGSTGILMLFLWLVHRSQKFKREKKTLEFQKENILQERKIEKVQNETQIKILNATLDGKESERKQIAEILHNSVSALLSSAGLHLQAAKIELKENAPDEIEKSQSIISEAGEKIRDLSHKLISSVLLKFGLSYAMHDLCEKYSNSKLVFESNSKDIQRFSSEFEIKIHSIIEELINNIIKHSNANNANILLKQYDGRLQVRIYDDGDGFDVEKMRENISGGLGLTQIEARIKMMEGIFDIKSSKETGTRIFMDVPIPESN